MSKRVGLYCRVSSDGQNCEMQERELREFAASRGWEIYKVYSDQSGGDNPNRRMLRELMNDCRQRKIDILLIWKLDRLFRSVKGIVTTLDELNALSIEFASLKDPGMDATTPSGRLLLSLVSCFAEFELSLIRTRTVSGLKAARARGVRLGRPPVITKGISEEVMGLKRQGLSVRKIEKAMKRRISRASIFRILKANEFPKPGS